MGKGKWHSLVAFNVTDVSDGYQRAFHIIKKIGRKSEKIRHLESDKNVAKSTAFSFAFKIFIWRARFTSMFW